MREKFGIYLNKRTKKLMRISSPYWIPSGDEWVLITEDLNKTLVEIRGIIKERNLLENPEEAVWGEWEERGSYG